MIIKFREFIRLIVLKFHYILITKIYGMDISNNARISYGARLDKTYPKGIHINDDSYVASGAIIFSHDFSRSIRTHTWVGRRCFVGANAIIMAGVTLGDSVVVGSGSVVTKDVPSGCVVVGNPAKILRENIKTGKFGKIIEM